MDRRSGNNFEHVISDASNTAVFGNSMVMHIGFSPLRIVLPPNGRGVLASVGNGSWA